MTEVGFFIVARQRLGGAAELLSARGATARFVGLGLDLAREVGLGVLHEAFFVNFARRWRHRGSRVEQSTR